MGFENVGLTYGFDDYYWSDLDSDSDGDKSMSGHSRTNPIPGDTAASAEPTSTTFSAATSGPSTHRDTSGSVEMLDAAITPTAAHTPSAPSVGGNVAYPTLPSLNESSSSLTGAQQNAYQPTLFGGEHSRGKKREREEPSEDVGRRKKAHTASGMKTQQQSSTISKDQLLKLLHNGTYSDYSIRCAGIEWNVHLNIITTRARGLLPQDLTPGGSCTISDHTPTIIESCLEFAYSGDYSDRDPAASANSASRSSNGARSSYNSPLHHHILLFGAAAAFEMPELMTLTLEKMQANFLREGWSRVEYEAALYKCRQVYSRWEGLDDRMIVFFQYIEAEGIKLENPGNPAEGMEE